MSVFATVLLISLMCADCAQHQPVPAAVAPVRSAVDPATQLTALELRIVDLVQSERHKLDPAAKTLVLDPVLMDVARKRAADMAKKGYFNDSAPDGTTSATMVMDEDATFQGLLGVNIAAQHYAKNSGINVDAFAQRFVDTWVDSKSHRQNLGFADYNRTGVGAALNGDTIYVMQLFATNLGLPPPSKGHARGEPTKMPNPEAAKSAMMEKPPALRR